MGEVQRRIAVLETKLKEKYPALHCRDVSPPYRVLSAEEDEASVRAINEAKPDIVWVGLGAPKQEDWMYAHQGRVNGVMIGVGAGFDYHAGRFGARRFGCKKASLEWLYLSASGPKASVWALPENKL